MLLLRKFLRFLLLMLTRTRFFLATHRFGSFLRTPFFLFGTARFRFPGLRLNALRQGLRLCRSTRLGLLRRTDVRRTHDAPD
jgi:hypothetical protein